MAGEGVKGVGASWAQKIQPQGPRGDRTPPGAHRAGSQGVWGRWSWTSRPLSPQAFLGSLSSSLPLPPYKGHCCTVTERNILSRHLSGLNLHTAGATPLKTIQVQDAKLLAPLSVALGRGSALTYGPTSCQPPSGLW